MKLIVLLAFWMALFALLLRLAPQGWDIPLYLVFLAVALLYLVRERQQIMVRRSFLQDELDENRRELQDRLSESRQGRAGEEE